MFSPVVENLIAQLSRLPGIGTRTAQRLAFHLLRVPEEEALALAEAIREAKERIGFCRECGNLTEEELCVICLDTRRDRTLDLRRRAAGRRRSPWSARTSTAASTRCSAARSRRSTASSRTTCGSTSCCARVERNGVQEVVLATNPNMTGEATAGYIADRLRGKTRVTRLASGLPVGGDLEYADEVTLGRALAGRREM